MLACLAVRSAGVAESSSDRNPDELGVAVLVEGGDGVDQAVVLAGHCPLAARLVGYGLGQPDPGASELALDLVQPVPCLLHVGARDLEVVPCRVQVRPRPRQRGVRPVGLLAGLVEVRLRVLGRVLCLRLLVTQVLDVGLSERGGRHTHAQGTRRDGDDQALADGGGEETHR